MKDFYILCFALITCITLNAQVINIPDANFKNALVNYNCIDTDGDGTADSVADLNTDGEIQVSEAEAVINLILRYDLIDSLQGIEAFTNLQVLDVTGNRLVTLDISSLTNLVDLNCSYNDFTTLEFGSNPSLTTLNCSGNFLTSLQGIEAFTNLQVLNARSNNLAVLDNSLLTNIVDLDCGSNDFTVLDFGSLPNLTTLNCSGNDLSSLNLSGLTNLVNLRCDYITLSSLDLSALTNLQSLSCGSNQLTALDVSMLINLQELNCRDNQISALELSALTSLNTIDCSYNQLTAIEVSNNINLTSLSCSNNQLTALEVSNNINLTSLSCSNNQLTALEVSNLTNLAGLSCGSNQLTELDVSMLTDITSLWCESNQLTELNVSTLTNLNTFNCGDNQLTELDVTNNPLISAFYCYENQLTFLDLSNKTVNTFEYAISDNQIETLILKNGNPYDVDPSDPDFAFDFFAIGNNPLTYVCADEFELELVNNLLNSAGIVNCAVSTYCSFEPGGEYYTIEGNTRIDIDSDGCDMTDANVPYLNFEITNGSEIGNFISNGTGNYNIPILEGLHTITPILENPVYFSASPSSISVDFPTDTSPYMQDFCITPNGIYNDLEVAIFPLDEARPGFDAEYKIVFNNKGTTVLSGSVNLTFQDNLMDLVSANPMEDSQSANLLSWNFTDLTPFESREIYLTMNINSPMEAPPVNGDDVLIFITSVNSSQTDETPDDNAFNFNQTVVNSFDPNDKTCLEGDTISPEQVGEFVHYRIRFENTGTANAINIVVKDHIDRTKYDLSSLVPLDASHDFIARIKDDASDYYVEFIFENINLPFDDANNDGYVVFKIRTLDSLVLNDTIENEAEIYFDFNFPIITNTSEVTVATLSNEEFEFINNVTFYPNPTNSKLHIESINKLTSVEIYNLLGQQILTSTPNALTDEIDLSNFNSGVYLVKVEINNHSAVYRVIKE